jgi:4-amino-4-deoxy-L-arabinose transferase-like glycosyltransferase
MQTFREKLPLYCTLFAAFLLRVWALNWALPLKKAHIDESVVIFYTMRFFTGDLNPHVFFDYPTLFLYILGAVFSLLFLAGKAVGVFSGLDQFAGMFLYGDSTALYLSARLVSAAMGIATVYAVYKLGKENAGSGLIPALLLAFLPMHVLHSHYATVDVAGVFFLTVSFIYLARFVKGESAADFYKGAFLIGLAAAVKYYPALFFAPVAAFAAFKKPKQALTACGLALSGFLIGCPFAALDFKAFSLRFADRFGYIIWGGDSVSQAFAFQPLHVLSLLSGVLTLPLAVLTAAGVAALFIYSKERRRAALLWILPPAVYILFISTWKIVSPHYLLPAVPFLLIAAVRGLGSLPAVARGRFLQAALAIAALALPVFQSIRADAVLSREDTRLAAYRWAAANIPPGSKILRLPYTPEFGPRDPFLVRVDWEGKSTGFPPAVIYRSFDYVITSGFSNAPYSEWEKGLSEYYAVKYKNDAAEFAPFHHPRITIYGKKR